MDSFSNALLIVLGASLLAGWLTVRSHAGIRRGSRDEFRGVDSAEIAIERRDQGPILADRQSAGRTDRAQVMTSELAIRVQNNLQARLTELSVEAIIARDQGPGVPRQSVTGVLEDAIRAANDAVALSFALDRPQRLLTRVYDRMASAQLVCRPVMPDADAGQIRRAREAQACVLARLAMIDRQPSYLSRGWDLLAASVADPGTCRDIPVSETDGAGQQVAAAWLADAAFALDPTVKTARRLRDAATQARAAQPALATFKSAQSDHDATNRIAALIRDLRLVEMVGRAVLFLHTRIGDDPRCMAAKVEHPAVNTVSIQLDDVIAALNDAMNAASNQVNSAADPALALAWCDTAIQFAACQACRAQYYAPISSGPRAQQPCADLEAACWAVEVAIGIVAAFPEPVQKKYHEVAANVQCGIAAGYLVVGEALGDVAALDEAIALCRNIDEENAMYRAALVQTGRAMLQRAVLRQDSAEAGRAAGLLHNALMLSSDVHEEVRAEILSWGPGGCRFDAYVSAGGMWGSGCAELWAEVARAILLSGHPLVPGGNGAASRITSDEALRQAIALTDRGQMPRLWATLQFRLGEDLLHHCAKTDTTDARIGSLSAAATAFRRSALCWEELGARPEQAAALAGCARALETSGELQGNEEQCDEARNLAMKAQDIARAARVGIATGLTRHPGILD